MAWNEEHLEFISAQHERIAFLDEALRFGRWLAANPVELSLPGRQLQQREVGPMQFREQAVPGVRPGAAEHVVDVRVREDESNRRELALGQPFLQFALLGRVPAAGVDQHGAAAIVQHVGVLLERIEGEGSDAEHDPD